MKLGRCSTVAIRPATSILAILTFAALIDRVVDAKTPNRPVEGVLHSGYFFPKGILWHSVRTSPGRYWLAYSTWMFGFVFRAVYCDCSEDYTGKVCLFCARFGDAIAGMALIFSSIVSATIADVSVIYFAGLCYIQTFIEAARLDGTIAKGSKLNAFDEAVTIWFLNWTLVAASVLATSYGPLDILSAVYFVVNIVIIGPCAGVANFCGNVGDRRLPGMVASIVQFGFCTWSFVLTYQIDDVPRAVTIVTYTSTAVIFVVCFLYSFSDE